MVDDEFGAIAYKDKTFADKVLFWRKEAPMTSAAAGATTPEPLDVAAEQRLEVADRRQGHRDPPRPDQAQAAGL